MIYIISENRVICSKCKSAAYNKAAYKRRTYERDAWDLIEEHEEELYVCEQCGYEDYIDDEQ